MLLSQFPNISDTNAHLQREANHMSIRVIVADDHHVLRLGVISLLEMEAENDIVVVGEVASGDALFDAAQALKPDIIILDICMPGFDALDDIQHLKDLAGGARILILTAHDEPEYVTRLVAAGVSGYLLKDEIPATIVQAVQAVAHGQTWFSQRIAGQIIRSAHVPNIEVGIESDVAALTPREYEILQLIAHGKTNHDIAEELSLSKATVQNHVSNIYAKLGIEIRSQAVIYALRHNLVKVEDIMT